MKIVERNEVLPIGDYELVRPHFRARVITEKKNRRVELGDFISVVFENHDSALLQIQEMLRTERITSEPAIRHEIDTYNELVPGPSQVSFTAFVEIADKATRERALVDLAGLEDSLGLEVDGEVFRAVGKRPDGFAEGRTTAVHYLKVTLDEPAVESIRKRTAKVALVVNHPKLALRAELGKASVASLAEDLASS